MSAHQEHPAPKPRPFWQHPILALPGYWLVTGLCALYGTVLSLGRVELRAGMLICRSMPNWSFGRGGTMMGAVFLTKNALSANILAHEKVHQKQWKRYGLAFPILYFRAGLDPYRNRFEIEAGLVLGGYAPRASANLPERHRPESDTRSHD
ncbi:MAG: hypothetical protein WBA28_05325 [Microbacteriaceae bacterium]